MSTQQRATPPQSNSPPLLIATAALRTNSTHSPALHTASNLEDLKAGYRLGDVATRWFSRAYKSNLLKHTVFQLRAYTLREYPGSIAAQHIKIMDEARGWGAGFNFSMVALSKALAAWEVEHRVNATAPYTHSRAALHLRIGDGMGVARQMPPPVTRWVVLGGCVEHLHIVAGIHVDYGLTFLNQSIDYLREMRKALAGAGVRSTLRLAGAPAHIGDHGWDALQPTNVINIGKSTAEEADEDFSFMVDADQFIVGRGSFSFAIAEVRNLRGKPTWILENETLGLDGTFPQIPRYVGRACATE